MHPKRPPSERRVEGRWGDIKQGPRERRGGRSSCRRLSLPAEAGGAGGCEVRAGPSRAEGRELERELELLGAVT